MKTAIKTLEEVEKEIIEKAEIFKAAEAAASKAEKDLRDATHDYQTERERLQREAWAKEGLGWCRRCEKFYPQEHIRLLYTEGREWHGSEYTQSYGLYKRVGSFCGNCAEILLSRPRGGEEEFQCYKATTEEKDGFIIFVSGRWIPIPNPEHTHIDIERRYIPESEYCFGKYIECSGWPNLSLKIGEKKIL